MRLRPPPSTRPTTRHNTRPSRRAPPPPPPPPQSPRRSQAYFTRRADSSVSRDAPDVIRFANPRGKFCWMNSGLTALINAIKTLMQRGHQFHWPENMSWTSDANDRPFLSFLKDYVGRENSGLEDPVNVIRAFIRECKNGDYSL